MKKNSNRRGFTLVELMVVIAIIGMLATVVAVSVVGQKDEADRVRVQADMSNIRKALDLFKINCGYYPQQIDQLWNRPSTGNANRWKGPYLQEYPPKDPWGNAYEYNPGSGRSDDIEVISYGADGSPGGVETAADLSSKTINQDPQ